MDSYEGNTSDPLSLHKYLYCRGNSVNALDPTGQESLIGVSIGSTISQSLASIYNGTVTGIGNALQATLLGIQAGEGADEILTDFFLDETGLSLVVNAYQGLKDYFQDPEEAAALAYLAWEEQLMATVIVAMGDNQFGQVDVDFVPQCFVAGTLVATELGLKSIEEIGFGENVWAWEENGNQPRLRSVLRRFVHRRSEVYEMVAGSDTLTATGEHPFYVSGKGWIPIRDIKAGDKLRKIDGTSVSVTSIDKKRGDFLVYNFEVSSDHNYYVGQEGVLTHNANALRRNMNLRSSLLAAHHIVAIRAKGAHGARTLLRGILSLNDPLNGVALPANLSVRRPPGYSSATVHSIVHTKKYYAAVEKRLAAVAPGARIAVLRDIAGQLHIGKFPF